MEAPELVPLRDGLPPEAPALAAELPAPPSAPEGPAPEAPAPETAASEAAGPALSPPDPERIASLDLIRGVAILGVLLANITWFSGTGATGLFDEVPPQESPADLVVKYTLLLFVDGKFISQLAILFGVGLTLQADRAWAAGRRFTLGYLWRTILLLGIGLTHSLFLWWGDILTMYACLSLIAVWCVRLRPLGLLVVIGLALTWTATLLAVALGFLIQNPGGGLEKVPPGEFTTPARIIEVIQAAVRAPQDEQTTKWTEVGREFAVFLGRDNQTRVYREGGYGEQLFDRALKLVFFPKLFIFFAGDLLARFLFGAFLVRGGYFTDPDTYARWRPWLLGGGLLIGIPMHAAALVLSLFGKTTATLAQAPQLCGALAFALVYLTLLAGWSGPASGVSTSRLAWLQHALRSVGRLALTNYLSQTVICTTMFYSFGFGLYGTVSRPASLLVVAAVWALQLTLSPLYLRYFRIGPVEWAWRSLARFRVEPLLRRARPDAPLG